MKVLGIETTAHTFGAAVLDGKKVLSNVKDTYTTESGGMIPVKLVEHHVQVCHDVVKKALDTANVKIQEIDLIAFSNAPGQGHALRIGCFVARFLASKFKKNIVGVNHCIAHLEIGQMRCEAQDAVLLYASGANTQVIAYEDSRYRIFGETLDIGVGNMLDTFGRHCNLGFPAGPKIEKLALESSEYIELPYSVKGMDVNFGGILTNLKQKYDSGKYKLADLCYSLQEISFAMLVEIAERALAHTGKKELVIGGGVGCNKRLQEMCRQMCEERGVKFYAPENEFLVDNAAQIAWTGLLMHEKGKKLTPIRKCIGDPYERTDDVTVTWR